MGPIFVLAFWLIIGGIASLVGGLALAGLISIPARKLPDAQRKRSIRIALFLPCACVAYLFLCVIVVSIWSESRGKDMGWGDDFKTPVLGGYGIEMVDVADNATLYEISAPGKGSVATSGPGRVNIIVGVKRLEVRPSYLLGAANPRAFGSHLEDVTETTFFIVDTQKKLCTNEPSLAALQATALKLGKPLNLEPVSVIYRRYRWDRIDLISLSLLTFPPLIVFFLLARSLWMALQAAIRNQFAM